MTINGGSVCQHLGATPCIAPALDGGTRAIHAASSEPGEAARKHSHQSGGAAVRSSGYRPPLRGESHCRSLLQHLGLQNEVASRLRGPNPYIRLPDSDLVSAANAQFAMLKKLHEN
jgi:hypothetical protein